MASSEMVAATALPASTTGMPAAISAPNTTTSKISVMGTELNSARRKSDSSNAFAAALALAPPASATSRSGCAACTLATAA